MKSAIIDTVDYIKILAQHLHRCKPNTFVLVVLLDLGIPVNCCGFEYLMSAILLQFKNPMLDLANGIYPAIAAEKAKDISKEMIDAAIRSVIRSAWLQADAEIWRKYLPTISETQEKPPTNSELIAGLARIVELWQDCAESYGNQNCREEVGNGII